MKGKPRNGLYVGGFLPETENDPQMLVDLNKELIEHPIYAAYGIICGQSLREDAIDDGDSVLIDTIISPAELWNLTLWASIFRANS